ncbi:hypothetical protein Csa_012769 [Cucumis sativus]|nr:hypothetical protein Csa_012769 [Cucumis sativus]
MKKFELVFIPMPGSGHIISMVEMANILLARDHRLAVTMIAIKLYPWISKLMNISNHFLHSLALISFLTTSTNHLVGFVLDMFCSTMVDIANEFEVPSYAYCTSEKETKGVVDGDKSKGYNLGVARNQIYHWA